MMTHTLRAALGAALFLAGSLATTAQAVEWSAGVGVASLSYPVYRGASERSVLSLPVPLVSVRSENWRLGRDGAQLQLPGLRNLRVRLSANGSLPVDSDESSARAGMPDLDPSFELGPAIMLPILLSPQLEVRPELLIRAVIATDLRRFDAIGWVAQPRLTTTFRQHRPTQSSEWSLSLGPVLGSRRYHDYFYSVAPRFATPERAAYDATGGYGGWRSSASFAWQRGRLGLFIFAAHDALHGANFADSPLVQERNYVLAGLAISWRLAKSVGWDSSLE